MSDQTTSNEKVQELIRNLKSDLDKWKDNYDKVHCSIIINLHFTVEISLQCTTKS